MSEKIKDSQLAQMQHAIKKVVAQGPDFLAKKIPAEVMAQTMIQAVEDYIREAEKQGHLQPQSEKALELQEVLRELKGCGSGFLADRCDADCVARTINYIVKTYPH